MTSEEVHERLQRAFETLLPIRGNLEDDISTDSAFAVGEVLGTISKAKALVGRDIDQQRKRPPLQTTV